MTVPNSTKKNIDVAISHPKTLPKKAFCVSGKTILVIHEDLVRQLGINEQTWFQEEIVENGILLRICRWSGDIDNVSSTHKTVSKFEDDK